MTRDVTVSGLRFENLSDPLGTSHSHPRISWRTSAPDAWAQRSYEVEVTTADGTTVYGPVAIAESLYQAWPAPGLEPRERAEVRVRVSDENETSAWSAAAAVERGLAAGDWEASAISPDWDEEPGTDRRPPRFRRDFTCDSAITRARLYITAHGVFEAEINGVRVGDDAFAPGWTVYSQRLVYRTYDVTNLIAPGANAIGAWMGDGWYRGRIGLRGGGRDVYGSDISLIAQLELEHSDGTRTVVGTDASWQASTGPILFSGLYDGEHYDAREQHRGWSSRGFDSSSWSGVRVTDLDASVLTSPEGPPIRCTQELPPVSITEKDPTRLVVDFGQNLVGRVRFTATGPRGARLVLRHAEVLQDGELYTRPLRTAIATDSYTFAGDSSETWEPRFTYHGFRFVEVVADPEVIRSLRLVARVYHSDIERTGWFECSDPLLNRLHENVVWSTRGNFFGIPTDCPQRDERLGWTGDIQVFAPTANYLFDTSGLLSDWLGDVAREQLDDGTVPWFVPVAPSHPMWEPIRPGAVWGDVAVLTPWDLWTSFADIELLRRQWDSARAWVDLMIARSGADHLWTGDFQLGDWLDPSAPPDRPADGQTDKDLVANAYVAWSTATLARIATVLGKTAEAERYGERSRLVRDAFIHRYLLPDGRLREESQTGYALVIRFGLAPSLEVAGERLRSLVEEAGYRIATGFAGTPLISHALSMTQSTETAYRQLLEQGCPSWLYTVLQGGTTIWERWDSQLPDGTVNPGQMTSFNHYALGSVADWMHQTIGGLAPASAGYGEIRFEPRPGGGITWARTKHLTPYSEAAISWTVGDEVFSVTTTVPTGATGRLVMPSGEEFALGPGTASRSEPA